MKKTALLLIVANRILRNEIIRLVGEDNNFFVMPESEYSRYNPLIKVLKPDVILLDAFINGDTLLYMEKLKKEFPSARLIMLDFDPDEKNYNTLFKAGVSGCVSKEASFDDLLEIIYTSLRKVKSRPSRKNNNDPLMDGLLDPRMTEREQQVIDLISEGYSNKEIGKSMNISAFTVKSHVHNIMEKLSMHTRLEVANFSFASTTD